VRPPEGDPQPNLELFSSSLCSGKCIHIATNISKTDPEIAAIRRDGWANVPFSFEQLKSAALDARLGFEIAMKCFQLVGYNTHVDRLNVSLLE
jgi:hypothetical protein